MKILFSILALLLLAACQTTQEVKTVTVIQNQNLPDVPQLPPATLNKVTFDYPRDTTKRLIKPTAECKARKDVTTPDFLNKCTYNPVIPNTNIFVGLDQDNFKKLNENEDTLISREQQYRSRIDQINKERAAARNSNVIPAPKGINPRISSVPNSKKLIKKAASKRVV